MYLMMWADIVFTFHREKKRQREHCFHTLQSWCLFFIFLAISFMKFSYAVHSTGKIKSERICCPNG